MPAKLSSSRTVAAARARGDPPPGGPWEWRATGTPARRPRNGTPACGSCVPLPTTPPGPLAWSAEENAFRGCIAPITTSTTGTPSRGESPPPTPWPSPNPQGAWKGSRVAARPDYPDRLPRDRVGRHDGEHPGGDAGGAGPRARDP